MLKEKVLRETKNFALIFVYLWIILGLFSLHRSLISGQDQAFHQGMALINALVLAKVMLTLEMLRVGETFHQRPPIYRILFKAALFGLLLLCFEVLEEGVGTWLHGKAFSESIAQIGRGSLLRLSVITIITAVSLLPYFTYRELSRAIGERELRSIIFNRPAGTPKLHTNTNSIPPECLNSGQLSSVVKPESGEGRE